MPVSGLSISGVVLATTYSQSGTANGGTDTNTDVNGVLWYPLFVGDWMVLDVDVAVTFTGGTSPGVSINVDRYTGFETAGIPTPVASGGQPPSNVATAIQTGNGTKTYHIGSGLSTNQDFGRYIRVTWTTITGAPTAVAFAISVIGKGG